MEQDSNVWFSLTRNCCIVNERPSMFSGRRALSLTHLSLFFIGGWIGREKGIKRVCVDLHRGQHSTKERRTVTWRDGFLIVTLNTMAASSRRVCLLFWRYCYSNDSLFVTHFHSGLSSPVHIKDRFVLFVLKGYVLFKYTESTCLITGCICNGIVANFEKWRILIKEWIFRCRELIVSMRLIEWDWLATIDHTGFVDDTVAVSCSTDRHQYLLIGHYSLDSEKSPRKYTDQPSRHYFLNFSPSLFIF